MPKFFKQNLLSKQELAHELEAPKMLEEPAVEQMLEPNQSVKDLLFWEAPSRPFRKRDRSFYTTTAILVILVCLILLLAGEKLLIGAVLAFAFMVYVLNFVPPESLKYKISTQGLTFGDHTYHWQTLNSFWIEERDNFKLLKVLTNVNFPAMLIVPLGDLNDEEVVRVVSKYLPFHEKPPRSLIEKWADLLQKHFPLENPHH